MLTNMSPLSTMQNVGPISPGTCFNNCVLSLDHPSLPAVGPSSSTCKYAQFFSTLKRFNPSSIHTNCQYLAFHCLKFLKMQLGVSWLRLLALIILKNLNHRPQKLCHFKIASRFFRGKIKWFFCSGKIFNQTSLLDKYKASTSLLFLWRTEHY